MKQPTEPARSGPTEISLAALARLSSHVALLALVLLLAAAASAAAAPSPWWQLSTSSRPGYLRVSPDRQERQRLTTTRSEFADDEVFAAALEVGGEVVGCLGSGELLGESAEQFCEEQLGYPATQTAPELQAILEGPYGAGAVQVSGGPVGGVAFEVVTEWGVEPISLAVLEPLGPEVLLGTAATRFASEGSGALVFALANIGDAPLDATGTPLTITDELPDGVLAYGIAAARAGSGADPIECELPSAAFLRCAFHGELSAFETLEVEVLVINAADSPTPGKQGILTVSGANAPTASATQSVVFSGTPAPFGTESFSVRAEEEGGGAALQAGSHPFQVTSAITLRQDAEAQPVELPKDLHLHLPPELLANSAQLPRCAPTDFFAEACPLDSVIGAGTITIDEPVTGIQSIPAPIFNIVAGQGEPARFGLIVSEVPVVLLGSLDPTAGAATLTIPNISQAAGLLATTISLWGVPGDSRHDSSRGSACLLAGRAEAGEPCRALTDPSPRALLTLPAFCGAPLASTLDLVPWNLPRQAVSVTSQLPALGGCNRLPFSPRLSAAPTTAAAGTPTGLDLGLELEHPGALVPGGLGSAQVASAQAALPAGLTLNPAFAAGLGACDLADLARESADSGPGRGCPGAAKVGIAEAVTPLFPDPIGGVLFAATPFANRAGNARFGLYAIFKDPARGLFLVQPIRLDPDPATGRIVADLPDPPRLPIERLALHFNSGPRAPLTTPGCGSHEVAAILTPSSAPASPVPLVAGFTTDRDCAAQSFAPALSAGTVSNAAGHASAFVFDLRSAANEPNPAAFALTLPPGLGASFASVATCPEAATSEAYCPADSRLGSARIAIGPGPQPLSIPEPGGPPSAVYLAGPYRGAPYSLLIRLPAQAGPFDLGTVVLRAAVAIDPETAQATVSLAGLPQILAGVPVRYREIRLVLDRPGFILNPTGCAPAAIAVTATSASGEAAALRSRFRAADCAALSFKPRLRVSVSGALGRNGHPRIGIELTRRSAGANLAAAAFTLPAGELLDVRRIRALCADGPTPGRCPAASRLGEAVIRSPLLPEPLRGPLFLRTPSHRYPDLLAVLRGGALSLRLHGSAAAAPGGRLRLGLEEIPDLPLSRATLTLAGGRRGIVVNSASLCGRSLRAGAILDAHNGRRLGLRPRLHLHGGC